MPVLIVTQPATASTIMATGSMTRRRTRLDNLGGDETGYRDEAPSTKRRRESRTNGESTVSSSSAPTGRVTRSSIGKAKTQTCGFGLEKDVNTILTVRTVSQLQEDDGFVFSRKSKRVKTNKEAPVHKPQPIQESLREYSDPPAPRPPARTKRKQVEPQVDTAPVRTRETRQAEEVEASGRTRRRSNGGDRERSARGVSANVEDSGLSAAAKSPPRETRKERTSASKSNSSSTKIQLPASETPVIRRNQKLREKGNGPRRSSLGMRGRRASSLLDSGVIADPHPEIPHQDWFKHIADDIEPRKMRQLLVWCGRKALKDTPEPRKGKNERIAYQAAKAINEQLIQSLVDKPELSNWFKRIAPDKPPAPKKPNKRNIDNQKRLEENAATLQRLKDELAAWEEVIGPQKATSSDANLPVSSIPFPSALDRTSILESVELPVDNLATEEQPSPDPRNLLSTLYSTAATSVDSMADSLHKISEFRKATEAYAKKSLAETMKRLEISVNEVQREEGTDGIRAEDVLRALAGS